VIAAELLLAAAAEVRDADRAELAEAAAHAAYLLRVLTLAGTDLGHPPPHQVARGVQGLRLWWLQLRDLDGAGDGPVEARVVLIPTALRAAPE
jgi:hypothetical protein